MKIYLAGKMSGLTREEMNGWRVELTKELGMQRDMVIHKYKRAAQIECINPVDYYNYDNHIEYKAGKLEIMDFDLLMVKKSDILVVNLDYPGSIGTAIEVFEAYRHYKMPVLGFGTAANYDWVEACLTKRFDTQKEMIKYIMRFYYPIMQ